MSGLRGGKTDWGAGGDPAVAELFLHRGVPQHIRSDNGPEFIAKKLRRWLKTLEVEPLHIEPWFSMGERLH